MSRTAFYHDSRKDDKLIEDALALIIEEHPKAGFWKAYKWLREAGHAWNHKRVYRVYKDMGLTVRKKGKKGAILRVRELAQLPARLDHTWSLSFTSGTLLDFSTSCSRQPYRTIHIMDEHSREALHNEICSVLDTELLIGVLEDLVQRRARPRQLLVDVDPDLNTALLEVWGRKNDIHLSYLRPEWQPANPIIQKLNDIFKRSVQDCYGFGTIEGVRLVTREWENDYNIIIPHDMLGGATPQAYAKKAKKRSEHDSL